MYNANVLYGITGHVAEFPSVNRAIIHFELNGGSSQSAFLRIDRFHKSDNRLSDNQNLNKILKVGHKVKFSCHINEYSEPGQCKWFVTNCWREIESEHKVIMISGMMNVAGTITDLKQRHGTLVMIDLLGNEYKVYFLASKVYMFGKRLSSSKSLSSQLHVDDKVYFDAIPCFPEENNHDCNWFATCVHKGKKPEMSIYKDSNVTETTNDISNAKILNDFFANIKGDDNETVRNDTTKNNMDLLIDEITKDVDHLNLNVNPDSSSTNFHQSTDRDSNINPCDTVLKQSKNTADEKQTSEVSGFIETDLCNLRVEIGRHNTEMLHDIKLLTNDARVVFAKSEGIILAIINEEYGIILGEFQRNVFRSILFHRSNAFLFKMSLAHSKLSEIFIEGDRVRFIAVDAPKKFVCDLIATQVSVASESEQDKDQDEEDDSDKDDISEEFSIG